MAAAGVQVNPIRGKMSFSLAGNSFQQEIRGVYQFHPVMTWIDFGEYAIGIGSVIGRIELAQPTLAETIARQ